ncbi:3'-5' exonuclease, partial [Streptomyces sp. MCAF7]
VVALNGAHSADTDAIAACAVAWKIGLRHRWLTRESLEELHADQVRWAYEQQSGLRDHFARTPGKERLAATVRLEWPLIPAPRAGEPS